MQGGVELIKGEAGVDVLGQFPHDLRLQRAPGGLKRGEARCRLGSSWRLEDGVRVGRDLPPPHAPGGLKGQGLLGRRVCGREVTVTEGPGEATHLMHDTTWL